MLKQKLKIQFQTWIDDLHSLLKSQNPSNRCERSNQSQFLSGSTAGPQWPSNSHQFCLELFVTAALSCSYALTSAFPGFLKSQAENNPSIISKCLKNQKCSKTNSGYIKALPEPNSSRTEYKFHFEAFFLMVFNYFFLRGE